MTRKALGLLEMSAGAVALLGPALAVVGIETFDSHTSRLLAFATFGFVLPATSAYITFLDQPDRDQLSAREKAVWIAVGSSVLTALVYWWGGPLPTMFVWYPALALASGVKP